MSTQATELSNAGLTVCQSCRHGDHGDRADHPGCGCACHNPVATCFVHGKGRTEAHTLTATLDAEAVSDARQDFTDWLGNALDDACVLATKLRRAHSAACTAEPLAALVLLPLIKDATELQQKIEQMIGATK